MSSLLSDSLASKLELALGCSAKSRSAESSCPQIASSCSRVELRFLAIAIVPALQGLPATIISSSSFSTSTLLTTTNFSESLPFLRPLFPDAVLEPIRLHVDAKRYLCLIDSGYWADLSPASQHSLELQGGIFDAAQAEAFMQQPFASEAVRLRRYDDLAKIPLTVTPPLSHFESYFSRVAV